MATLAAKGWSFSKKGIPKSPAPITQTIGHVALMADELSKLVEALQLARHYYRRAVAPTGSTRARD